MNFLYTADRFTGTPLRLFGSSDCWLMGVRGQFADWFLILGLIFISSDRVNYFDIFRTILND